MNFLIFILLTSLVYANIEIRIDNNGDDLDAESICRIVWTDYLKYYNVSNSLSDCSNSTVIRGGNKIFSIILEIPSLNFIQKFKHFWPSSGPFRFKFINHGLYGTVKYGYWTDTNLGELLHLLVYVMLLFAVLLIAQTIYDMEQRARNDNAININDAPDTAAAENEGACTVCLTNKPKVAMIPCGHLIMCGGCARSYYTNDPKSDCQICKRPVEGTLTIYS